MAKTKPCIVCKKELERVNDMSENQPNDGVMFVARGNYGSTVWDPFDGSELEIIVCDECLVEAGDAGRVLAYKPRRLVQVYLECDKGLPLMVGWERLPDRGGVEWDKDLPDYGEDDVLVVEPEEVGTDLGGKGHIEWMPTGVEHVKDMLAKGQA